MSGAAEGSPLDAAPRCHARWRTLGRLWAAMLGRCPACDARAAGWVHRDGEDPERPPA